MGMPRAQFPNRSLAYTNASVAATFNPPIGWVQAVTAGSLTMKGEDGNAVTYSDLAAGDVISGPFTTFTSTTCTSIRLGDGTPPAPAMKVSSVNLAGGSPSVTGVLPGSSYQKYVNGGTAATSAFNAVIGTMHKLQTTIGTFSITMPPITAAIDGMGIALMNLTTGSTATTVVPTGSDNVGNSAGAATGATAAGPVGGAVKVYTADFVTHAWIVGF